VGEADFCFASISNFSLVWCRVYKNITLSGGLCEIFIAIGLGFG
jgi:hypothetical protein